MTIPRRDRAYRRMSGASLLALAILASSLSLAPHASHATSSASRTSSVEASSLRPSGFLPAINSLLSQRTRTRASSTSVYTWTQIVCPRTPCFPAFIFPNPSPSHPPPPVPPSSPPRPPSASPVTVSSPRSTQRERLTCKHELEQLRQWHAATFHMPAGVHGDNPAGRGAEDDTSMQNGMGGMGGRRQGVEETREGQLDGWKQGDEGSSGGESSGNEIAAGVDEEAAPSRRAGGAEDVWGAAARVGGQRALLAVGGVGWRKKLRDQMGRLARMDAEMAEKKRELRRISTARQRLDKQLASPSINWATRLMPKSAMERARAVVASCTGMGMVLSHPAHVWKAYACEGSEEELMQYLDYKPRHMCPDDWLDTQALLFHRHCFALPMRRCLSRTPAAHVEPMPFPQSLFSQLTLQDTAVRWQHHACKSFHCLNSNSNSNGMAGNECAQCFNMSVQSRRWQSRFRGALSVQDVVRWKQGALRVGLDVGGGTGSWAAHMARYNVTVLTTAINAEAQGTGRTSMQAQGTPYMETIALRGLIPLHVPHSQRLPLFDNTVDIIHCGATCMHYLPLTPLLPWEHMLFEWDRVLRVGGVLWLDSLLLPLRDLPLYVALVDGLGYKRLHWHMLPRGGVGEESDGSVHVQVNALLEKPVRVDPKKGWLMR
ncbi:unnamed protein product [Closterium sp. Naga37s-1]|nr:unnamed protein product [Closterium sp. Naga37s-1]